jgi:hypothetical protein
MKKKMIVTAKELAAFNAVEKKKKELEKQTRMLLKQAMAIQSEGMEALQEEQKVIWHALYEKHGITDFEERSYSINRETCELAAVEEQDEDEDDESCDDPNCVPCSLKRMLSGLRTNGVEKPQAETGELAKGFKVQMPSKSTNFH